jgi:hypothetical protein
MILYVIEFRNMKEALTGHCEGRPMLRLWIRRMTALRRRVLVALSVFHTPDTNLLRAVVS